MPFANTNFINGYPTQALESRAFVAFRQMSFLDVFDDVPTSSQVIGDVGYRHASRNIQGVSFKRPCVSTSGVGEANFDLADEPAGSTFDSGDFQVDKGLLGTHWERLESTLDLASKFDVLARAGRTSQIVLSLPNAEEDLSTFIYCAKVVVTDDSEGLVKQACHNQISFFVKFWPVSGIESALYQKSTQNPEEPKIP
jgi:hypothetical protein